MRRFPLPVFTAGLLLSATSALALPTDVGRSADVYQNAIRYFAARADTAANRPSPQERPAYIAELAALDLATESVTDDAADVPAQDSADVAPAIAEAAPSLEEPEALDTIADAAPDVAATSVYAVAQAATPALVPPAEDTIVEVDVIAAANDLAVEADVLASAEPVDDDVAAPLEDANEVPVSAAVSPAATTVRSSRQAVAPHPDVTFAADDVVPEGEVDLMAEMADGDENLVVREGGAGGVDTIMMSSDVLFSFGRASLADDALATLASIGAMADNVPVIEVFGHTDAIGSEANNLALGQRRAESVRAWLLQNTAFTEDRIIATGIGEVDPIEANENADGSDNPDGRARNRRVEFAFREAGYTPE